MNFNEWSSGESAAPQPQQPMSSLQVTVSSCVCDLKPCGVSCWLDLTGSGDEESGVKSRRGDENEEGEEAGQRDG